LFQFLFYTTTRLWVYPSAGFGFWVLDVRLLGLFLKVRFVIIIIIIIVIIFLTFIGMYQHYHTTTITTTTTHTQETPETEIWSTPSSGGACDRCSSGRPPLALDVVSLTNTELDT